MSSKRGSSSGKVRGPSPAKTSGQPAEEKHPAPATIKGGGGGSKANLKK